MNLIFDIGNSRVKVALVEGSQIEAWECGEACDARMREVVEAMIERAKPRHAMLSSTRGDMNSLVEWVESRVERLLRFDHATPIPMVNSYATPETLGCDRLAAAIGAEVLYGVEDRLVIDFGSAITIDLITCSGGFEGGVISPGVGMRLWALNDRCARLPLCAPTQVDRDVARTTRSAIEQGVMRGVLYEVEGHIARFEKKYGKNSIIFTGGDAKYFDKQIKSAIFAQRDLVVVGLNRILEYNVNG